MSLCDLGFAIKFLLALFTQANVSMESNPVACLFSAILGNFFGIAVISWYFMISVCVYASLQPQESRWRFFLEYPSIQHGYVWTVSTFAALLPWWTGHYGTMDDGAQCWISRTGDPMKLTLGVPLYSYFLFDCYLISYVFFLSKTTFNFSARIKEQMIIFVGVYVCAWFWAALAMTWEFIAPGTFPVALHYMDVGAISGSGFFNFVCWLPQIFPKKPDSSINPTNETALLDTRF